MNKKTENSLDGSQCKALSTRGCLWPRLIIVLLSGPRVLPQTCVRYPTDIQKRECHAR